MIRANSLPFAYTMETNGSTQIMGEIHRDDPHPETNVRPHVRLSSNRRTEQSRISGDHTMRSRKTSPSEKFELAASDKTLQIIKSVSGPPSTPSAGGGGPSCFDDGPDLSRAADYKPSPLRTWYLGMTLLVITTLFCLTVVARQTLPDGSNTFAPHIQIETNGNVTQRDIGSHVNWNNEQHYPRSVRHSSHASAALYPYPKNFTKREARPQTPTGSFMEIGSTIVQGRANPFTLPNPHTLPTWATRSTQSGTVPSAIGRAMVVGTAQPTTPPKSLGSQIPTHNNHGFSQDRDLRGTLQQPNDTKVTAAAPTATPGVGTGHSKRDISSSMIYTPLASPQPAEPTETSSNSSPAIHTAMPNQSSSNSSNSSTYQSPPPMEEIWQAYDITTGQYFMGLMLPTLFATLLAIPLRSIEFNYKLYRPFHNLLHPHGATAASSLFLPTTGLSSFFVDRDIITCSTISLLALSAVLIPISAEAIHLNLHGRYCHVGVGDADNCAMTVGVSPAFAHLAMAILLLMGALLILTWTRLRRYRTAVPLKPWNVSFMEKFASDPTISSMLSRLHHSARSNDKKDHVSVFDSWTYTIDAQTKNAKDGCRVVVLGGSSDERKMSTQTHDSSEKSRDPRARNSKPASAYSFILTTWGRILLMLILLGTLITVLVYSQNSEDNGFEHFMDSEKIGVRLLFSTAGVVLTTLWTSFFQGKLDTSFFFLWPRWC